MKRSSQLRSATNRRTAFTLLELLAVITIISILLALLMPVLSSLLGRGDEAAVSAEMTQLNQALAAFKAKFGDYPPSYIKIPKQGDPWDAKSRAAIKAIWPQFDFSARGGLDALNPVPGEKYLSGAECLVFFLGGMESGTTSAPVLAGFSKNPLTPWTVAENADGPFMEFDFTRLTDVDGDNLFEYLDPYPDQSTPLLYVSASGGRYNKSHTDPDDYSVFGTAKDMAGLYTQADGKTPHNSDSFQLISPGADGEYGSGGPYTAGEDLPSNRQNEVDNITNFSGGTLN